EVVKAASYDFVRHVPRHESSLFIRVLIQDDQRTRLCLFYQRAEADKAGLQVIGLVPGQRDYRQVGIGAAHLRNASRKTALALRICLRASADCIPLVVLPSLATATSRSIASARSARKATRAARA